MISDEKPTGCHSEPQAKNLVFPHHSRSSITLPGTFFRGQLDGLQNFSITCAATQVP